MIRGSALGLAEEIPHRNLPANPKPRIPNPASIRYGIYQMQHLGRVKHLQPLPIGGRVIHDATFHFCPGVRKEWSGAITDHQARGHITLSKQSHRAYRSLQAEHGLPVQASRQKSSVANGSYQLVAGWFRGDGLPA